MLAQRPQYYHHYHHHQLCNLGSINSPCLGAVPALVLSQHNTLFVGKAEEDCFVIICMADVK